MILKAFKYLKWPLIAISFFLMYFPIIIIAILSINESKFAHVFKGFSLKWYGEIFTNSSLFGAITNTITVAVVSTIISTILGTFIAIGINSLRKRDKKRILLLNNIPLVNPDIVTGLSLMIVFSFIQLKFGFPTMLLAHVFFSVPYVVLSVLPKLRALDKDLYNAAIDLGCTTMQAVLKVIVPAIKSGIITGSLIAFTMSIDDFVISYFTTGNGYSNFSIWLYARLGRRTFSPAAYAYNTLITTVTFAILLAINIKSKKRQDCK
ncbi:ABC transporter permease [Clostridium sp. 'deep sea']|uniref:ABC transporter permease n=1 Tax=Clostridium sp. 'deep sea' TaxID=2779445 RepID=UPI0018967C8B|nr:ABC transporter permease [Clostridium sp. 'deep sea']QOR35421.1 ABC transporter permease [Clostridium sp. 'deep sea']